MEGRDAIRARRERGKIKKMNVRTSRCQKTAGKNVTRWQEAEGEEKKP
jgi:hypothetical protein